MRCVDLPFGFKAAAPVGKTERIVGGGEKKMTAIGLDEHRLTL
jgi:hypothetical protein